VVFPVDGTRKVERPGRETGLLASDSHRGLDFLFFILPGMLRINDAAGKLR
jgi:hypothetical protein